MSTIPGIGSVEPKPALDNLDLLAAPVAEALEAVVADNPELADQALAVAIDPDLADTEAMTEAFGMDLSLSADVNHVVKKTLNVRKASFWPQEKAVEASGMEYGGITPVGLPSEWRLLIDTRCTEGWACIGSGLRSSKLFITGELLKALPDAEIIEGLGVEPK